MELPFYRACLQDELARRQRRNPRHGLRAFAKSLEMDAGSLSRVLAGSRPLSLKAASRVLSHLRLTPRRRALFLESIFDEKRTAQLTQVASARWVEPEPVVSRAIAIEHFKIIGNWYHSAILELTFVEGFRPDPVWIGAQLGIAPRLAKNAVERLIEAGLLQWANGRLEKTSRSTLTADRHRTSLHLRRHATQMYRKAIRSFSEVPIEERSSTGNTLAIDPAQLPAARRLIDEFTEELVRLLETGRRRRVYHLGITLFPLQKKARPRSVTP
jgi:uncharacterized protein (TIGR02147 family)